MTKRTKKLTKRERKDLYGKGPSGVPYARQNKDAEVLGQQMDAIRSSGMLGTPDEFDDAMNALANAGVVRAERSPG